MISKRELLHRPPPVARRLRGVGVGPLTAFGKSSPTLVGRALWRKSLVFIVLGISAWGQPGCGSGPGGSGGGLRADAQRRMASGDWDDVSAAVAVSLSVAELVLVSTEDPEPTRRVFHLRSSRDEPAELVVERLSPVGAPDPVELRLSCTVGRFGDAARERAVLGRVAERLGQLRGVEVSPIHWE